MVGASKQQGRGALARNGEWVWLPQHCLQKSVVMVPDCCYVQDLSILRHRVQTWLGEEPALPERNPNLTPE